MKLRYFFSFSLIFIGLTAHAQQRAAVLDFKANGGVSQETVDGITAIFATYFQPEGYTMVERTQIGKVIDEQGFQHKKSTERQSAVKIGQILNVSKVIVGDVNFLLGKYNVDARVINVETGTIDAAKGVAFADSSYRTLIQSLSCELAGLVTDGAEPTRFKTVGDLGAQYRSDTMITLYGYLHVFPRDLGVFDSIPNNIINRINEKGQFGYCTWRIPTGEELNLLKTNDIVPFTEQYLSQGGYTSGRVRLVTDDVKCEQLSEQRAEMERQRVAELERQRQAAEVERQRLAAEAERQRLANEAERQRLAAEAERQRLAAEAERQRLEAAEAERQRLEAEKERQRLEAEAEAERQRLAAEAERQRLEAEAEAERQRIAAEEERLRLEAEAEAERQRLAEEAERKRLEEERAKTQPKTFTVGDANIELVYVKGGTFSMGCTPEQNGDCNNDEKPVHNVTLTDYYIGKYEVTQKLWVAVMGKNPSNKKGDDLPVENVSWNDVQDFISKLNQMTGQNFSLPTEAQWEYAARGGSKSKGYKFSGSSILSNVAWYADNSGSTPHPVGTKEPNELGIYDMSGNVWEWCYDYYADYSSEAQTNPTGPTSGSIRVLRGGSWSYFAGLSRVSYRLYGQPGSRFSGRGFRLVLVP